MPRIVISVITAISSVVGLVLAPIPAVDNAEAVVEPAAAVTEPRLLTSFEPAVSVVGGSPEARRMALDAVDRFVATGLALPDIEFRFHDDFAGCNNNQGMFQRDGDHGTIELCTDQEFLALHEISHAWARFTLNDNDRAAFVELAGAHAWQGADIAHHLRGTEIAADSISYALLSHRGVALAARPLELFEALTGIESPRIAEKTADDAAAQADTPPDNNQHSGMAAYAAWQATQEA